MPQIDLIQLRRGWASDWTATNPVLSPGEPGVEMDTGKMKFGNGTTPWNDLPYTAQDGAAGPPGEQGEDGFVLSATPPPDTGVLWGDTTMEGSGNMPGPPGPAGPPGAPGPPGAGIPSGGTAGQVPVNTGTGTTAWQSKPMVDVRDYGATGNGTTNDTASVQAAIDAAAAVGGEVFLPSGTFLVGNLTMGTGARLAGASQGGTKLRAAPGTTGNLLQIASFCQVTDLTIDGAGLAVTGLRCWRAARSMLSRLYITNVQHGIVSEGDATGTASHAIKYTDISIITCTGDGIKLGDFAYDSELLNVWIGSANVGVRAIAGAQMITNLHVWGCTSDGVVLESAVTSRLVNTYLESNAGWGLRFTGASRGFTLSASRIWNNGAGGVYLNGGDYCRIIGNSFEDNIGPGLLVENNISSVISGNSFFSYLGTAVQTYGIRSLGTSNRLTIVGNDALDIEHVTAGISTVGIADVVLANKTSSTDRTVVVVPSVAATDSNMAIDGPAGNNRSLLFRTGQSFRWIIRASAGAESGSNAGSDLEILARTDAGGTGSTPLTIVRSTGEVRIATLRHNGTTLGFYNTTPVTRRTLGAAATDATTTQALVNTLRQALIDLGLGQT